jgi:predicted nuclease of predicted toxin-antitoxin system
MSILVDHCVPRKFLRLIRDWGYDASLLTDYLAGDADDEAVLALAQRLDAVLLTADLDFANILNYPPGNYAGIMVMRYGADSEAGLILTVRRALEDLYRDALRGILVIIEPQRYRIRRS